jgi:hypothetical protein
MRQPVRRQAAVWDWRVAERRRWRVGALTEAGGSHAASALARRGERAGGEQSTLAETGGPAAPPGYANGSGRSVAAWAPPSPRRRCCWAPCRKLAQRCQCLQSAACEASCCRRDVQPKPDAALPGSAAVAEAHYRCRANGGLGWLLPCIPQHHQRAWRAAHGRRARREQRLNRHMSRRMDGRLDERTLRRSARTPTEHMMRKHIHILEILPNPGISFRIWIICFCV